MAEEFDELAKLFGRFAFSWTVTSSSIALTLVLGGNQSWGNGQRRKVANIIVDQSLKDSVFSKEAGRICYTIIQAESKQVGQALRRSLLNRLQQEDREALRTRSLQAWICYVTFIYIFDYLRVNNMPMMALVNPVYDCLFRLAQPDSLQKEEEVDCLVLQLHRIGEQLEKMNSQRMDELFSLLRDGFLLQEGLSSLSQLLLLEIIEFRAAEWKMTDAAQKYYYSEVTVNLPRQRNPQHLHQQALYQY
ncbi:LOW QUALITY PROTEIN: MIF4G domain-containing protein [Geothlypis trichas]